MSDTKKTLTSTETEENTTVTRDGDDDKDYPFTVKPWSDSDSKDAASDDDKAHSTFEFGNEESN
jgi:hypothetical protein